MAPADQEITRRALDVAEWAAKLAAAFGIVAAFMKGIWVPYRKWRLESLGRTVRIILEPELTMLTQAFREESDCADRMGKILKSQEALFGDIDLFLEVAMDNRDRLDEMNQLLDAMGLESDRRQGERRLRTDDVFDTLSERRKRRRRGDG